MTGSRAEPRGDHYLPPGQRESFLADVEGCDREAESARQDGDQQKLLGLLEKGLYLRRCLYAESSPEVAAACRRLCEVCNCAATAMLQKNNTKGAHELLKRAEQVSEKSDLDRAITWNNLACYYRRMGKFRTAVTFLERALAIEEHTRNADAAQTHLNLCATLSQLQRHVDALYHAQSALIRIYEILAPLMLSGKLSTSGTGAPGEERHEQVTVLCIAYHNLAVEHEYLKNFEAAICSYAEGARWASGFLGPGHQLIDILRKSVDAVKAKLPANSGALKRAQELTEGFPGVPLRSSAPPDHKGHHDEYDESPGRSPGGSKGFDHLITPRGSDDRDDDRDDDYDDREDYDSPGKAKSSPVGEPTYSTDDAGDDSVSYNP